MSNFRGAFHFELQLKGTNKWAENQNLFAKIFTFYSLPDKIKALSVPLSQITRTRPARMQASFFNSHPWGTGQCHLDFWKTQSTPKFQVSSFKWTLKNGFFGIWVWIGDWRCTRMKVVLSSIIKYYNLYYIFIYNINYNILREVFGDYWNSVLKLETLKLCQP